MYTYTRPSFNTLLDPTSLPGPMAAGSHRFELEGDDLRLQPSNVRSKKEALKTKPVPKKKKPKLSQHSHRKESKNAKRKRTVMKGD